MYSLSDHYIFATRTDYNPNGDVVGQSLTKYDITPIFILILVLILFFVLNDICHSILRKIKRKIEDRKNKKPN